MFRLRQEEKRCKTAAFLTLTYSDENVNFTPSGLMTLNRKDHTDYMKRFRKFSKKLTGEKLTYYTVGEYGSDTERPHFHSILFNAPEEMLHTPESFEAVWQKGHVQVDKVSPGSIAYVCGYVNKQKFFSEMENDDREPEYSVMSKGIGDNFLSQSRVENLKQTLDPIIWLGKGQKMSLPRYYRDKVLSDQEKAVMALKTTQFIEEKTIFKDEKHRADYVHIQHQQRIRNSKKRNAL